MPLTVTLENGDDELKISYDHTAEEDIKDVVFILAGNYPTALNSLETVACSSTNTESLVQFNIRSLDT